MEYISAEEFKKQHKEVQKVFLDWWKPSLGDLFFSLDRRYDFKIERIEAIFDDSTLLDVQENKGYYKPLFSEGQLRKFIEDKTHCFIELIFGISGYVVVFINKENIKEEKRISALGHDLLQIYWKIALEIAEGDK